MVNESDHSEGQHILKKVWDLNFGAISPQIQPTNNPQVKKIFADFFATGKYYYYVLNIPNGTISNHRPTILEMHPLTEYPQNISEIINLIHPDDLPFVVEAESKSYETIKTIGVAQALELKSSYCFRMLTAEGNYELFHHQALHTQLSEDDRIIQSINIHTNIQHITEHNPYTILISGIGSRNDFHQIKLEKSAFLPVSKIFKKLTRRELEILNHIAKGNSGNEISQILNISEHTVKSHRKNILKKLQAKNSKELIRKALELAII